jgi:hypothetical protein
VHGGTGEKTPVTDFWLIVVKPSEYGSVLSVSRYFTVRHVMLK